MSDFKGTPGPWSTDTGGDVTRSDGTTLLTREKPYECTLDESFANAELAAAAPDLLSVAYAVDAVADRMDYDPDSEFGELVQDARAAIAKATGEQP